MLLNCSAGEDSLRVPWTTRRSNQSILKEINPECLLAGLMLKPKFQQFGQEKTLMLGKIEGRRRRAWQRTRWVYSITNSMVLNLNKLQDIVEDWGAWHAAVHGVAKRQTWLSDWTVTGMPWGNYCDIANKRIRKNCGTFALYCSTAQGKLYEFN